MTETPYPQPGDATISYSLREVIDQINRKLDLIPQIVSDQATMRADAQKLEARVLVVEGRLESVEKHEDQAVGAALFKDRFTAKLVALAGVMGVVAGITVQIISSL
jgi:ATP/maltotriose-dependent transcriptional regulator MalT